MDDAPLESGRKNSVGEKPGFGRKNSDEPLKPLISITFPTNRDSMCGTM